MLLTWGSRAAPISIAVTLTLALSCATFAAVVLLTRSNSACTDPAAAALSPAILKASPSRLTFVARPPTDPIDSRPNRSIMVAKRSSLGRPARAALIFWICASALPLAISFATSVAERPNLAKAETCASVAAVPASIVAMKFLTPVAALSGAVPVEMIAEPSASIVSPEIEADRPMPATPSRYSTSCFEDEFMPSSNSLTVPMRLCISVRLRPSDAVSEAIAWPASCPVRSKATPNFAASAV